MFDGSMVGHSQPHKVHTANWQGLLITLRLGQLLCVLCCQIAGILGCGACVL